MKSKLLAQIASDSILVGLPSSGYLPKRLGNLDK